MTTSVFIVVLNWNNFNDTKKCIDSVLGSTFDDFLILLIDNGSSDDSLVKLKKEFEYNKKVTFLSNQRNFGYAGGVNPGIRTFLSENKFKYLWVLNNDIVVDKNALKFLVDGLASNTDSKIAGPTIFFEGTEKVMEQYYKLNLFLGKYEVKKNLDRSKIIRLENNKKNFIGGAAIFLERDAVEKINIIPEEYFMYNEDVDWHMKIKGEKWGYLYIGPAHVWHKRSASSGGRKSIMPDYYDSRNFLYFIKKFYPLWLPYELLTSLFNKVLPKILRREWIRLRYVFWGFYDFFAGKMGIFERK
ncbi:MAG: glycosyl transferase family protein [Parcubacteria group bacterium LiPW_41]|nr:MAG: glycosyl transferase family protein [Parcubacteria group bacterium LiPW_41]